MLYGSRPQRGNGKPNGNPADRKNRKQARVSSILTKSSLEKFGVDGNSRSQFQAFLATGEVPAEQAESIKNGKSRLVDMSLFSIEAAGVVTKFFQSGSEKMPGISNLKGNTLPKGYGFLVSKIRITSGQATDATDAARKRVVFKSEPHVTIPAAGGAFVRFSAQNRSILQEIGLDNFHNYGAAGTRIGEYTLANPRFIGDNGEINFEIQCADIVGMDANTVLKVELIGTMLIPM